MSQETIVVGGVELQKRYFEMIAMAVVERLTNKEIAQRTGYSLKMVDKVFGVKDPTYGIYRKIGVSNRRELVKWYHTYYADATGLRWDDLFEEYRDHRALLQRRLFDGDAQATAENAHLLAKRIQGKLREVPPYYQQELLGILAQVLSVEGWSWCSGSLPGELWTEKKPLVHDLRDLATKYNDARFDGLRAHFLGNDYFIARKYPQSLYWLMQAVGTPESLDDQACLHRTLALIWGIVGEKARCEREVEITKTIIEECLSKNILRGIEMYEGIVRALCYIGSLDKAYDLLQKAMAEVEKVQRSGGNFLMWHAMFVRAQIELAGMSHRNDVLTLESSGREVAHLVRHRTPRAAQSIEFLLDRYLNSPPSPKPISLASTIE
jgi:DNA-binding CsgD family transcriptional regulator